MYYLKLSEKGFHSLTFAATMHKVQTWYFPLNENVPNGNSTKPCVLVTAVGGSLFSEFCFQCCYRTIYRILY
jgi:hypothetical protein